MQEICQSGSEGGARSYPSSLPLSGNPRNLMRFVGPVPSPGGLFNSLLRGPDPQGGVQRASHGDARASFWLDHRNFTQKAQFAANRGEMLSINIWEQKPGWALLRHERKPRLSRCKERLNKGERSLRGADY